MESYCPYYNEPIFELFQGHKNFGPAEFMVMWVIDRKSQITGRMSFAEIAKDTHLSVRTVGTIVRKLAGKCLTYASGMGVAGIIRANVKHGQKHPGSKNTHPSEPKQNLPGPDPENLPVLPEEILKALSLKQEVKGKEEVKGKCEIESLSIPPPPTFFIEPSEQEKTDIAAVFDKFYILRGIKQIIPRNPEDDLCLRILGVLRCFGTAGTLRAVISHFQETRQASKQKFDTFENCFPAHKINGLKIKDKVDTAWIRDRIDRSYRDEADAAKKEADEKEQRARIKKREEREDPDIVSSGLLKCRELIASL